MRANVNPECRTKQMRLPADLRISCFYDLYDMNPNPTVITPPLILHATPPLPPLPVSDAESIYYAALLTLTCPNRWALTTAKWSENNGICSLFLLFINIDSILTIASTGKIPYITHLGHLLHPKHFVSIPIFEDPDERLSRQERADSLIWTVYIEQQVTDLIVSLSLLTHVSLFKGCLEYEKELMHMGG